MHLPKKFNVYFKNCQLKHNPNRVIFNYSKISLSDAEKSLLAKRCCFSLPPKKPNYADYLTNFKLFCRNILNLNVLSNNDLDFVETKIKDAAVRPFCCYNVSVSEHVSNEELKKLFKRFLKLVLKADKGNSVVLVDRDLVDISTIWKIFSTAKLSFGKFI